MKTTRGIYHDLIESEYTYTTPPITFYFSSRMYQSKFAELYKEEIERFNQSINNVYKNKFTIEMDELALIRLYTQIEKRGFYLTYKGVDITCPEDLVFVGIMSFKEN